MNRFDLIYVLIAVSIVSVGYLILWTSPALPGSWKKAGRLRRSAFHFSLWLIALLPLAMFSLGLGAFLLHAPFYYYLLIGSCAAIASSITVIEIVGVVIKSSAYWSDRKRGILISTLSLINFTLSTSAVLLVKSKIGQ
jgi:hypothetical protein